MYLMRAPTRAIWAAAPPCRLLTLGPSPPLPRYELAPLLYRLNAFEMACSTMETSLISSMNAALLLRQDLHGGGWDEHERLVAPRAAAMPADGVIAAQAGQHGAPWGGASAGGSGAGGGGGGGGGAVRGGARGGDGGAGHGGARGGGGGSGGGGSSRGRGGVKGSGSGHDEL